MATYKNLRKVLNLPTLSASPSSGVNGEMYFNTGDSALYIYDGEWKKVTQSAVPFEFQGTEYLWTMMSNGGSDNYISKAAIASDANWSDTGRNNFQKTRISSTVSKSSTAAFVAGGSDATTTKVQSFTFAGSANAVEHCALSNTASIYVTAGATSMTNGYALGGYERHGSSNTTQVQKWVYSSNSAATLVGNLASHVRSNASAATQSSSNAYVCGGSNSSNSMVNSIQKWNFAAESTATNSGTLTSVKKYTAEASDINGAGYGYVAGGADNSANLNVIERVAFASDGNGSDVGDLTYASKESVGHSSNTHGYVSEGVAGAEGKYQKYAFAASGNASAITATNQAGDPTGTQS